MRGVIADVNIQGQIDDLIRLLETDPWSIFWAELQISYFHFADVGLANETPDSQVWQVCQDEQLVLITDNRNQTMPIRWKRQFAPTALRTACPCSPSRARRAFMKAASTRFELPKRCSISWRESTAFAARAASTCLDPNSAASPIQSTPPPRRCE